MGLGGLEQEEVIFTKHIQKGESKVSKVWGAKEGRKELGLHVLGDQRWTLQWMKFQLPTVTARVKRQFLLFFVCVHVLRS